MKILTLKDRIKITIDGVEFYVSPLSREAKRELAGCRFVEAGEEKMDLYQANSVLLKYGLKDVKGLTDYEDNPYELEFDGDVLKGDCISDILNIPFKDKLLAASWSVSNGSHEDFNLDGVALEVVQKKKPES